MIVGILLDSSPSNDLFVNIGKKHCQADNERVLNLIVLNAL